MTRDSLALCLWHIQQHTADDPVSAIELARLLSNINGNHENRRRRIREHVFELRQSLDLKDRIGADTRGYWWNGTTAEMLAWRDHHRQHPFISLYVARKIIWDGNQAALFS